MIKGEAIFNYHADTGCKEASIANGGSSQCEQCPFPDCIHGMRYVQQLKLLKSLNMEFVLQ
jgi:hypothetical protein